MVTIKTIKKLLLERSQTTHAIFKTFDQTDLIQQKCVKFCSIRYQIYLIQQI